MKSLNTKQIVVIAGVLGVAIVALILAVTAGPSEKELTLERKLENLERQIEEVSEPEVIYKNVNPSMEDITRAEILERNAIRREVQEANNKIKSFEKKKALETKLKLEELNNTPTVEYTRPTVSTGTVQINTKQSPLTLRSNSSTNSKALDAIPKGTNVTFGSTKQIDGYTWYSVEYNGKQGWVRGDYIKEVN